jgi:hypothetical protein
MVDPSMLKLGHSMLKKREKKQDAAGARCKRSAVGKFPIGNHFKLQNGIAQHRGSSVRIEPGQIGLAMGKQLFISGNLKPQKSPFVVY